MIYLIANIIIIICLFALFTSILINFAEAKNKKIKRQKKSIVETGTMTLFFLIFYSLIRFRIGEITLTNQTLQTTLIVLGLAMIIFGTFFNILGRFNLGKNWANQVKIYNNQNLITTGTYGIVRHPLYSSLMLMFYGACLIYPNYLAFLANTFIFIPFMYYRAKQEEKLLSKTFKEYEIYKKKVGMFFPKL